MAFFANRIALLKPRAPQAPESPPAGATLRSQGAYTSGIAGITPDLPAGYQPNDVLLMFVECDSVNFLTGDPDHPATPAGGWAPVRSGFTPAGRQAVTGSNTTGARIAVFWVRGSAVTAQTIVDTGDHTAAFIQAWQNVKLGADPFGVDAVGGGSSMSTTLTLPGLTTPSANCRVIYACADPSDTTTPFLLSAPANASLTDMTLHYDGGTLAGSGGVLAVASGFKATAGASGDMTATVSGGATTYRYITVCLESA